MRSLFAALLLLFQLQPVLGAVACLGAVRTPAQQDCQMPEHGTVPSHSLSAGEPMPSPSCALATVCTPAPLSIPAFTGQLVRAVPTQSAPLTAASTSPIDIGSAPPLPPPRA